jgi:hypothetical protein
MADRIRRGQTFDKAVLADLLDALVAENIVLRGGIRPPGLPDEMLEAEYLLNQVLKVVGDYHPQPTALREYRFFDRLCNSYGHLAVMSEAAYRWSIFAPASAATIAGPIVVRARLVKRIREFLDRWLARRKYDY